jgi:phosphoglycolate phosphatase-like HAD superfamily hydrolase
MKVPEHQPRHLTPQDVRHILGDLDDAKIAAILATEATPEELEEVAAWASGESDVMGELERPLEGVVATVYDILMTGEDLEERD